MARATKPDTDAQPNLQQHDTDYIGGTEEQSGQQSDTVVADENKKATSAKPPDKHNEATGAKSSKDEFVTIQEHGKDAAEFAKNTKQEADAAEIGLRNTVAAISQQKAKEAAASAREHAKEAEKQADESQKAAQATKSASDKAGKDTQEQARFVVAKAKADAETAALDQERAKNAADTAERVAG
jgi:ABC-type Na+ efflux pump permease subunit